MFSMILISHLNFTTKRERIPYILAFFESCLLEYLKSQVDVDKSTETQVRFTIDNLPAKCYNNNREFHTGMMFSHGKPKPLNIS